MIEIGKVKAHLQSLLPEAAQLVAVFEPNVFHPMLGGLGELLYGLFRLVARPRTGIASFVIFAISGDRLHLFLAEPMGGYLVLERDLGSFPLDAVKAHVVSERRVIKEPRSFAMIVDLPDRRLEVRPHIYDADVLQIKRILLGEGHA